MDEKIIQLVELCEEEKISKDDILTANHVIKTCAEHNLGPDEISTLAYILVTLDNDRPR